jgi:acetyltransferase-like isoleucine patch superfamily enzyme
MIRTIYTYLKKSIRRLRIYSSINWIKSIYFNFKMLPFNQARKLPVIFYGRVKFAGLQGKLIFDAPLKFGMVGFGQRYEIFVVSKKNAQLTLNGTLIFKGHVQFGIDYLVLIGKNAILEMGNFSSLGGNGKIVCTEQIRFGDFARVGFESQIIDSNFHEMTNLETGEVYTVSESIQLGKFNYIGNRVTIMPGTITPDYCTIASSSLCNKDYTNLKSNVLIGGIPAKLIRNQTSRAWDKEIEELKYYLTL